MRLLVEDIKKFSTAAYEHQEEPMAVRCHLLALVLNDPSSPLASISGLESKGLMEVLMAVFLSNPLEAGHLVVPKWLGSHLLITEALLLFEEEPHSVTLLKEDEPLPETQLFIGPPHVEARSRIFDFCLRLISTPSHACPCFIIQCLTGSREARIFQEIRTRGDQQRYHGPPCV